MISSLGEDKKIKISEKEYEAFGKAMADALNIGLHQANSANKIRMSNVGKPLRRLWYDLKSDKEQQENYILLPYKVSLWSSS